MASSTSPSEPRRFRPAAWLLLTGLAAWGLALVYTLRLNPEIAFHRSSRQLKQAAAERVRREHGAVVFFTAGSSGMFSVDATRLQQKHGLPAVNFALGAGLGPGVILQAVAAEARRGDTLVVAFEPFLLTEPMEPTAMGMQFSFATGHPEWVTKPFLAVPPVAWPSALLALRPGGYHCVTLLGKLVTRRPWYRYHLRDVDPNGLAVTDVRLPPNGPPEFAATLPPAATNLLTSLATWGQAHGVKLLYSLPWGHCPTNEIGRVQRRNANLVRQIAAYMPALRDPALGVHPVAEDFSDSVWHLTREAATRRTDGLAELLQRDEFWSLAELNQLALP
jgi:hypothetical protein